MHPTLENVHLAKLPRKLPHPLQVAHIGFMPAKTYWVDWVFDVVAFSIVLSGSGELFVKDQSYKVRAPCVLCEFPGTRFRYGPRDSWHEVFFKYDSHCLPQLTAMGLAEAGRFLWPLRAASRVKPMLGELAELCLHLQKRGAVDRIDRLSEWIISETLLDHEGKSVESERLLELRAFVEEHYTSAIDFQKLAKRFGFSFTSFRRAWAKYVPESPALFLRGLRMKQACRLLCETDVPIGDIARQLGFDDPLYFSKAFHRHVGMAARDYRQKYTLGGVERYSTP